VLAGCGYEYYVEEVPEYVPVLYAYNFEEVEIEEDISYEEGVAEEYEPPEYKPYVAYVPYIPFRHVYIPILMYHTSSEYNPGPLAELYVRPSAFEAQMVWLVENGFTFVTFDDWDMLHTIERPVMVTFDDGYPANYTEIFPILQQHDVRIVLFLTLLAIDGHGFSREMIQAMHDSGLVQFEAHTMTHPDLTTVNETRLRRELSETVDAIYELTGRRPVALAYPAGRVNDAVAAMTLEYYRFGLIASGGWHYTGDCELHMRRVRISRSTSQASFESLLSR
jgi:peptidoglycan/xylan/chitin deacetylase (PgdA/CDA1 family)